MPAPRRSEIGSEEEPPAGVAQFLLEGSRDILQARHQIILVSGLAHVQSQVMIVNLRIDIGLERQFCLFPKRRPDARSDGRQDPRELWIRFQVGANLFRPGLQDSERSESRQEFGYGSWPTGVSLQYNRHEPCRLSRIGLRCAKYADDCFYALSARKGNACLPSAVIFLLLRRWLALTCGETTEAALPFSRRGVRGALTFGSSAPPNGCPTSAASSRA